MNSKLISKNGLINDADRLYNRICNKSIMLTNNVSDDIEIHEIATQAIEDASWIHEYIIADKRTRRELMKGLGMLRNAYRTIRDL